MKAIRLRTEYLKDPMGIDIPAPRLFWNCQGGVRQTAYQITAETGGSVIWDSGRVESAQMTHIPYGGTHSSRQRVEWKVRVWDENGTEGPWSEPAFFEMGLLKPEDWSARWISGDYRVDKKARYPVDCFRRTFSAGNIVKARLYASALRPLRGAAERGADRRFRAGPRPHRLPGNGSSTRPMTCCRCCGRGRTS